jgi:hypothetical protein
MAALFFYHRKQHDDTGFTTTQNNQTHPFGMKSNN